MIEISLHLLDIVQNSIKANAENIKITVYENTDENILTVEVEDDGFGMDEKILKKISDPFFTTSDLKKVGLGISLLKFACENAGGFLDISSKENEGTKLKATFVYDHINRQPLGDMAYTVTCLLLFNLNVGFIYKHTYNGNQFVFNSDDYANEATNVVKNGGDLELWLNGLLKEKIENLYEKNNHSEMNENNENFI